MNFKRLDQIKDEEEDSAEIERLFNSAPGLPEDKINRDYPRGEHGEYRSGHEFEVDEEELKDGFHEKDATGSRRPGLSRKALNLLEPSMTSEPSELSESDRGVLDKWIRERGTYERVMEFLRKVEEAAEQSHHPHAYEPEQFQAARKHIKDHFNRENERASDERMQSAPTTGSRRPGLLTVADAKSVIAILSNPKIVVADAVLKDIFERITRSIDSGHIDESRAANLRERIQAVLIDWLEDHRDEELNVAADKRSKRLAKLNKIAEGEDWDVNTPWPEGKPKRFGEPGYEEFLAKSQEAEDKKKKDPRKAARAQALRAIGQYFDEPTGTLTVTHKGSTYILGVSVHWHGKMEAGDGYPDFEIETAEKDGRPVKLNEDGRVKLIELAESQEGSGWAELNDKAMSQVPN